MAKVSKDKVLFAHASVRSIGGTSLFSVQSTDIRADTVQNFGSDKQMTDAAVRKLQANGFDVLQVGDTTISISAPIDVFEKVFKTRITSNEEPVIKEEGKETTAEMFDSSNTDVVGLIDTGESDLSDVLEGVSINRPVYYFANKFAPTRDYWHLTMPGDVSLGLNADRAHRAGYTGRGIRAVMVDSGWYRHPYFVSRGYRTTPVVLGPGASAPDRDESGHGTGESANLLAAAPDATFTMVKMSFVDSAGSFNAAVALNPHIISCSWGSSVRSGPLSAADNVLAAAVANAVRRGIIVVFSAGNGHFGFPGQHPDVISAGGVFMQPDGSLMASDYASGFASLLYPGRNVPDVSGLVGMRPSAAYIMLPVEPGDEIDTGLSGGTHPAKDETANNDGWAAFSGTSAAAPQLAGICALMKQANARLTPAQTRDILKRTAIDVTAGIGNPSTGGIAGTGYDLATGAGLADAHRATLLARLQGVVVPTGNTARPMVAPVDQFPGVLFGNGASLTTDDYQAFEDILMGLSS
ncbi:S8 family serine peptidase [Spirosoma utsteinense]|uniref:Subtilisin family serine protease n=1 Tax=Spirosoma utsteinense TaxID=2585773 RepID=A0ABR6W516_9BACT|nr:S8 family serine peptidase [Spirosoma utsteinense]MBC3787136.1 subtilisin family serine protease [Spirosoma utsteinense]MBC3791314.1 subtilisin family serine protease [Spirosoma utsteinense]